MNRTIVIVSGLPRSGTSLMMQMLRAGGLPVLSDDHRANDDNNPRGYLEFEPVKALARDQSWLASACGKAVKVIVQLLPHLPPVWDYRVLMMQRPLMEVVASQGKMMAALGKSTAGDPRVLSPVFERHLRAGIDFVRAQSNMSLQEVAYHRLLRDAPAAIGEIAAYLAPFELDQAAMRRAIDPSLYRTVMGTG